MLLVVLGVVAAGLFGITPVGQHGLGWARGQLSRLTALLTVPLVKLMVNWISQDSTPTAPTDGYYLTKAGYPGTLPSADEMRMSEEMLLLGKQAYRKGSATKAIEHFSEGILYDPTNHLLFSNRSMCWASLGRFIEALDDAEMAIAIEPKYANAYYRKGNANKGLGRRRDAANSYRKGLELDPSNKLLQAAFNDLPTEDRGMRVMCQVLLVNPHLQLDKLFTLLDHPEQITPELVRSHRDELDAQYDFLTQTLFIDTVYLFSGSGSWLLETFNKATLACGQIVQWAPEAVTEHLTQAKRIVNGLGIALRMGWQMHHWVAKFAANALTVLATSNGASDPLRREAVRLLLGGMLQWLVDSAKEPDSPQGDREVCGCSSLSPRISATTWMERLFDRGSKPWVVEECERFPDIILLTTRLCLVVRDERAAPLGLSGLLRIPSVAKTIMMSDIRLDLHLDFRYRPYRASLAALGATAAAMVALSATAADVLPPAMPSSSSSSSSPNSSSSSDSSPSSAAVDSAPPFAPVSSVVLPHTVGVDGLMWFAGDPTANPYNLSQAVADRIQSFRAPHMRMGEWIISSLSYMVMGIDEDMLFSTQACSALKTLALSVPDGLDRLRDTWIGIPLVERLAVLAFHHNSALELLETIVQSSTSACTAVLSLAVTRGGEDLEEESTASPDRPHPPSSTPEAGEGPPPLPTTPNTLPPPELDDVTEPSNDVADVPHNTHALFADGVLFDATAFIEAAPEWVEHHAELGDELQSAEGVITLNNFSTSAAKAPCPSTLAVFGEDDLPSFIPLLTATVLPSLWNTGEGLPDNTPATLTLLDCLSPPPVLKDSDGPRIVVFHRSLMRKTLESPNWASAVHICAKSGVDAVIVINDLEEDGPGKPAFRMGLFGASPPSIPAYMMAGTDGEVLSSLLSVRQQLTATVTKQTLPSQFSLPPWPLLGRTEDIAQAWCLVEMVDRLNPTPVTQPLLKKLMSRMQVSDKRVWLRRKLQRVHSTEMMLDDSDLVFIEGDRTADQREQLLIQWEERIGLGAPNLTHDIEVRFKDESSVGSAVMREWMDLVAKECFLNPANHLLHSHDNGATFLPDPLAPYINPNWKADYEMLGRLIGLALWQQVTLDLPLHPYLCYWILEMPFNFDVAMLRTIDSDLADRKIKWMRENSVDMAMLTFTDILTPGPANQATGDQSTSKVAQKRRLPSIVAEKDILEGTAAIDTPMLEYGTTEIELVAGGEDVEVTDENKEKYIEELILWKLKRSIEPQIRAIIKGLHTVVPSEVLRDCQKVLPPEELSGLIAGLPKIDVNDWMQNYGLAGGLTHTSREVQWFWEIVREWDAAGRQDRLQNLLQFATGSRRVPVGGFAQLVGFNGGKHLFTLSKGVMLMPYSLPTAHACICTIDLPPWPSKEVAAEKMLLANDAGNLRFEETGATA